MGIATPSIEQHVAEHINTDFDKVVTVVDNLDAITNVNANIELVVDASNSITQMQSIMDDGIAAQASIATQMAEDMLKVETLMTKLSPLV